MSRLGGALLIFIVLFGAGLRLLWIQAPLLDGHRWRQVDTAGIARSLYEDNFNVFYPQVNWGGAHGYVESEFPLLPAIVAVLYKIFGEHDYFGRIVSMICSTATIPALFLLGSELVGPAGGLAAAFFLAVSPGAVFFGRTFMPDSMMMLFWVLGVLAFVRYFKSGSARALWWGSAAATVACLVKLPALMMFAPIAAAGWHWRKWSALRDRRLLVALAIPLLFTVAWYWHAFELYKATGITFGILVHPARTYPISIAPGPWPEAFSKWSRLALLTSGDFYTTIFGRLYVLLFTPWGFAGVVLGLAFWSYREARLVADAWLLAFVAFLLVMAEANIGHEYYQLPVVPAGALYFGAFAGPLFDRPGATRAGRAWRAALLMAALLVVGGVSFYYSGVVRQFFRPDNPDTRVLEAGQAIERVVPPGALMIVTDDYGVTSPLLLYFAHRKGWSFDVGDVHPQVIDGLKRQGAAYFVSTVWSRVQHETPDVALYLRYCRRVPLQNEPPDTVVFELARPGD